MGSDELPPPAAWRASIASTAAPTSAGERSVVRFAATAAQFAALVWLVHLFRLESTALERVLLLALAGFAVHHFLWERARLPFFACLSVASIVLVLGWKSALLVIGAGALLVSVCHLPIPFGARVTAVLTAGAGIAFLRAWLPVSGPATEVWPILASMFMFRLAVYLYDLRHRAAPFSPWRSAAYFSMLPNISFMLFPVVDYKTFCRSHYNEEPVRIYQVGLVWMLRGIVHLLLYRLLYQNFLVDPHDAVTTGHVVQYVLTTFFLYLRVSGTFHLAIGLLHMFGFNLPETHHLYFLATSFTDFWRRINIYWKDFITKLVFYPVYFRIRVIGEKRALVLATLGAFLVTWLLHSYQWFWIRGRFPVTWQDFAFWMGLAALVTVNVLREARGGRGRRLTPPKPTLRSETSLALRVVSVFFCISVLWAVWSTPSEDELANLARAALEVDARGVAMILGAALAIGLAAVVVGRRGREHTEGRRSASVSRPFAFWSSAARVAALSAVLLALGLDPALLAFEPALAAAVSRLRENKLNVQDSNRLERGYYEELGDPGRFDNELWALYVARPQDWNLNPARRMRRDFLVSEYRPGVSVPYKGATLTTNSWGMRDKEYAREPPPGVYRVALLGASHEVGDGVEDDETYQHLVEERFPGVEILNLAVGGYGPFQKLAQFETKALAFSPDAVFFVALEVELEWTTRFLEMALKRGTPIPAPLREALEKAGVRPGTSQEEISRRLEPHRRELLTFVLARVAAVSRERGIDPYLVLLPMPNHTRRSPSFDELRALGSKLGFRVLDLASAYDGVGDRSSISVADYDSHPNAEGHRLLAKRLEAELRSTGFPPADRTGGSP